MFDENGNLQPGRLAFVYSYVCITVFMLLQVVVAVLLDSFYRARLKDQEEMADAKALRERKALLQIHPLDPLLEDLANGFDTVGDLNRRLNALFQSFDTDRTGTLSFTEFFTALFKLKGVRLRHEDFERWTAGGKLCNADQELEPEHFRIIMRRYLRKFVQRRMADAARYEYLSGDVASLMTALKLTMLEVDQVPA